MEDIDLKFKLRQQALDALRAQDPSIRTIEATPVDSPTQDVAPVQPTPEVPTIQNPMVREYLSQKIAPVAPKDDQDELQAAQEADDERLRFGRLQQGLAKAGDMIAFGGFKDYHLDPNVGREFVEGLPSDVAKLQARRKAGDEDFARKRVLDENDVNSETTKSYQDLGVELLGPKFESALRRLSAVQIKDRFPIFKDIYEVRGKAAAADTEKQEKKQGAAVTADRIISSYSEFGDKQTNYLQRLLGPNYEEKIRQMPSKQLTEFENSIENTLRNEYSEAASVRQASAAGLQAEAAKRAAVAADRGAKEGEDRSEKANAKEVVELFKSPEYKQLIDTPAADFNAMVSYASGKTKSIPRFSSFLLKGARSFVGKTWGEFLNGMVENSEDKSLARSIQGLVNRELKVASGATVTDQEMDRLGTALGISPGMNEEQLKEALLLKLRNMKDQASAVVNNLSTGARSKFDTNPNKLNLDNYKFPEKKKVKPDLF
jgi:hypothetical protein